MSDILDPQTTAEAAPELAEAQQEATGTVPQVDAAEPAAPEAPAEPAGPTFLDLGLDARVLAAVEDLGYTRPSPIQEATIPLLLDGRDVVGLAQTGTGKTGAFALPALSRLAETTDVNGRADTPQVLVLAPTRELALQVADAFDSYAKHLDDVSVLAVYGGSPYGPQLAGLRRVAQVVVGTPGRVIDHLERGSLDLSDLQTLVLDEADEMLRMGFAEEVDRILASTPDTKQTALFSATMPPAIRRISAQYLNAPEEVAVARQSTTSATIRQRYLQVGHQWKFEALSRILETEEHDGVIAFVRTRAGTEELAQKLTRAGFKAVAISGDIAQKQREKTVEDLKAGRVDILVATDVAARGLDVERISHVVNYDIPQDAESYVHRIGRTGRAGRQGDAVLFMTPRERFLLKQIERTTRQQVEEMAVPSVADVNAARKRRFADGITRTLERASEEELAVFGEIVAAYVDEHEAEPARVAAALGLALAVARRIPAADRAQRAGAAGFRESARFTELAGKTALIVGWGAIGRSFGRMLDRALGMTVLVHSPRAADTAPYRRVAGLAEGLAQADLVSLHTPLRAETRGMMGPAQFAALKPGAILLNLARAGLVDEPALCQALASGRLAGAGLDVWSGDAPQGPLAAFPNVVFTPHLGGTTEDALIRVAEAAARHVIDALSGRLPETAINPEVWSQTA